MSLQMSPNQQPGRENTSSATSLKTHLNSGMTKADVFKNRKGSLRNTSVLSSTSLE